MSLCTQKPSLHVASSRHCKVQRVSTYPCAIHKTPQKCDSLWHIWQAVNTDSFPVSGLEDPETVTLAQRLPRPVDPSEHCLVYKGLRGIRRDRDEGSSNSSNAMASLENNLNRVLSNSMHTYVPRRGEASHSQTQGSAGQPKAQPKA